jgi:flagellar biosynthesis GTPase FlhF
MNIQNKEDLLGLIKKEVLHCPNCGAEFEMNNDKYKLINFNDKNNNIWIKYHEKSLYEEEWLNIICGGISNEEKKKINEEKEKELKRNKIKVEEERRKNQEREKQKRIEEQKRKNQEIERQRIVEEERKKQQIAEERKKEEVINRNNRSPSHEFQNYTITGARLDEPRSIRRNLGSSAPFLFKRTRIYYSQSESHDEWRTISFGDITVKETGVFFVGEMASRKFDRKKILDVSLHKFMAGLIFKKEEWGIRINVENRQKPSIITLGSEELALELVNKIINAYNI